MRKTAGVPEISDSYLTTRELADLLRIGERKVYELAARGEVPCVRAVGKLLFPRDEVHAWLAAARSGPEGAAAALPAVVAGSHDPLLDWALRESGSGLAAFFDGSFDGLDRFARREAVACAVHMREAQGWNTRTVAEVVGERAVVLVEFAIRRRGLIVAPGNPHGVRGLGDLATLQVARRQESSASARMFGALAQEAGLDPAALAGPPAPARTEDEVARRVLEGAADAAFGLEAVARQLRLDFVPVLEERFDLLVWRRAWFEEPFQKFLHFAQSGALARRAGEMGGYETGGLGRVRLNGAAG